MHVVVREVLAQHTGEVTGSGNEKVVEAFPAQGPDEACCRPRCLHMSRRGSMCTGRHGVGDRLCWLRVMVSPG